MSEVKLSGGADASRVGQRLRVGSVAPAHRHKHRLALGRGVAILGQPVESPAAVKHQRVGNVVAVVAERDRIGIDVGDGQAGAVRAGIAAQVNDQKWTEAGELVGVGSEAGDAFVAQVQFADRG